MRNPAFRNPCRRLSRKATRELGTGVLTRRALDPARLDGRIARARMVESSFMTLALRASIFWTGSSTRLSDPSFRPPAEKP
ncbi:MAG: hypothetical protein M0T83_08650 [Nitrospiraceae bacterium]|nr:hypothetical protein [Nitrospiraceae bacterium]